MLIVTQLLFTLLNLVEAKLESIVIALKDPKLSNYTELNRQEHTWSAIYYSVIVGIVVTLSYITDRWSLVPLLLANRRLFFQEGLNYFRGIGFFKLSNNGLDGYMKRLFGKNAGLINTVLCIILIIVFNLIKISI